MIAPVQQNTLLGALCLLGEMILSFAIASAVKLLEPQVSVFVVLFFRYLFCLPLLFAYGLATRGRRLMHIQNTRVLVLRTVCGFLGLLMWFLAVANIDISLATALAQTMPIFITVLAALIIGEQVGIRRIGAVSLGFCGVVLLLFPITADLNIWGVGFALSGAFFAALMFIYLRVLGQSDAVISTALWYNLTGLVLAALLCLLFGFSWPAFSVATSPGIWQALILVGVLASFQQMLLAKSHAYAKASVLAPVHYATIPIGILVGVLLFNEVVGLKFFIGTGIILLANYYILRREQAQTLKENLPDEKPV